MDLKAAVTHLKGDEDQVQSIRGALFDKVKAVLRNIDVEVAPEDAGHNNMSLATWMIAREILQSGDGSGISEALFTQITSPLLSIKKRTILLSKNVFMDTGMDFITFQSSVVKAYFKNRLANKVQI